MTEEGSWPNAWTEKSVDAELAAAEAARLGWLYAQRFTRKNHGGALRFLSNLGEQDLQRLRQLRFLASSEIADFVRAGQGLIDRLPQATFSKTVYGHEVRGRINWPATLKARLGQGGASRILAQDQSVRHYDVPEARAVAFVLDAIETAAAGLALSTELADVVGTARRLRSHPTLSGISSQSSLSGTDQQRLRASRVREITELMPSAVKAVEGLLRGDIAHLRQELTDRGWLPAEPDKVFELWLLFTIAEQLDDAGWALTELRLLATGPRSGSRPLFRFEKGAARISLLFQGVPSDFVSASRYKDILSLYSLDAAIRRPDIIATVEWPSGRSHLLVEAKLTENAGYILDSVYKVFGYLGDFADVIESEGPTKAALCVWGGVNLTGARTGKEQIAIVDAAGVRQAQIVDLLEAMIAA
ncbi:MAG: hypothetical protein ACI8U3_000953 [Brevundimonas sp.]|uniref:hypothetical protein n=1 Tax=Brevundimonas sp. TaxID=1871086 RepID=UPI0039E3D629